MTYLFPALVLLALSDGNYYFSLENRKTSEKHLILISEVEPISKIPFCRAKLSSFSDRKNGNSSSELGIVFTREKEEACDVALDNNDYFVVSGCLDVLSALKLSWDGVKLGRKTRNFPLDLVNSIRCVDFNRNIILKSKFGTALDIEVDRNFERVLGVNFIDGTADPSFDWQRKRITRSEAFDYMTEKYQQN